MTTATPTAPPMTRDIRQQGLIPPDRLAQWSAIVVGVGATGHQVARQLAAIGVPEIAIVDHDTVGIENVAVQGFEPGDVGQSKVAVVADTILGINDQAVVYALAEKLVDDSKLCDILQHLSPEKRRVVFCCVDSMESRHVLHSMFQGCADLFVDPRMGAESGRVVVCDATRWDDYRASLHSDAEAFVGPCTARSTIYCANIIAGLAVSRWVKYLRGHTVEPQVVVNIVMGEMEVAAAYN